MGLKDALIDWIFKNARIPKTTLLTIIEDADTDSDGYIDIPETVHAMKKAWEWIRDD